jgi:hypothetical protein
MNSFTDKDVRTLARECDYLQSKVTKMESSHQALVEALEAIAALRPPLMTREQEKAFEYHPSTCDAYRVDLSTVLLEAISQALAALALAKGGNK